MLSSKSPRWLLALAILVFCVGCDQATKRIATRTLRGEPPRSYLGDTLRLEYALNPGGFLSVGANLPPRARFWLFTVANSALLAGVAYVLARNWNMRIATFVALLFFFAGGIGNLIDRLWQNGLVTDFAVLSLGPFQTGIINVADVALSLGGLAWAILYHLDSAQAVAAADSQPE